MALTEVKTGGIDDDAVTQAKMAPNAVITETIADASVSIAKMAHESSSNSGKFLRANNGSACTWETVSAGTALTGSTDNQITTVTGANAIQGEANLTYDGNNLTLTTDADGEGIVVSNSGNTYNQLTFDANRSSADAPIAAVFAKWNGNVVGSLQWNTGADTTNKDDGYFDLRTTEGGTNTERVRVHQGGNVEIKTGNLIIGTSGKGIDFSATSDTGGMSSELLDDYEVGSWTPAPKFGGNSTDLTGSFSGSYVKVGKIVTAFYSVIFTAKGTSTGTATLTGFPFTNGGGAEAVNNSWGYYHRMVFNEANDHYPAMNLEGTTSTMRIAKYGTGENMAACSEGNFTNSSRYDGCMVYRIS